MSFSVVASVCLLGGAAVLHAQQDGEMRRAETAAHESYIVVLRGPDDPLAVGVAAATEASGRLRHVYQHALRGFAIDLPAAAARALASDPRVLHVEEDVQVLAAAESAGSGQRDRIDQRPLPQDGEFQVEGDGSGVHVHVLDSGIRTTHSEFQGRAFIANDYVDDDRDGDLDDIANDDHDATTPDGSDCHGTGTHAAAVIGGATAGVARNVTLWAHRVLDCNGAGSLSTLLAAIDSITADHTRRPAVANIGVTTRASMALDTAIRNSTASGVTYVVVAGNGSVDASSVSPARVAEAITVAAIASNNVRAKFSNFGASVDIFAPGESIVSAGITNDTAVATLSGTATSAAYIAGVAALHLAASPAAAPAAIHDAVSASAITGITNGGANSPDRLVSADGQDAAPSTELAGTADTFEAGVMSAAAVGPFIAIASPNTAVNWGVGSQQQISWQHNLGLNARMKIEISRDGGKTYSTLASAHRNSSGSNGAFTWTVSGATTTAARIRVSTTDGRTMDVSDVPFTIAAPFVQVTSPNGGENWVRGKTATVSWIHNLGDRDRVEIALSTNGGSSYSAVLDSGALASRSRTFTVQSSWLTNSARIRVAWRNNSRVSDISNSNFTITSTAQSQNQAPSVALSAPADGATFTAGAAVTVSATATDSDGTIARVDFYRGATLIGSDTTAPYSVTWSNVSSGSYSLTARATDDDGAASTSAVRTVTVTTSANAPPTVSLTAPANGATFAAPATIALSASASDVDGTISRVDFRHGSTLIGSDTTAPYSVTWSNVAAGSYSLTATAVDSKGASTTSAARTITVSAGASPSKRVAFTPSIDHGTLVNAYRLEIFAAGANPGTATPIATQNLGKPAVVNGECTADISTTFNGLASGSYQLVVAAVGSSGSARSTPPVSFTK